MANVRQFTSRTVDALADRVTHVLGDAGKGVRTAAIPEEVLEQRDESSAQLLGGVNVEEGFSGGGLEMRNFSYTGVPLLDSFYFQYTDTDHHLSQILILPDAQPDKMQLGFHDKNRDDDYFFKVVHRMIIDQRVEHFSRSLDLCTGSCMRSIAKPAGDFVFVLVGFQLAFTGGRDHHINVIEVRENDGRLTTRFADKNFDDNFVWSLKYAYLPRGLFSAIGESGGVRERGGARRSIPSGPSVIRGFRFDFKPYFTSGGDHHIRDVGVMTHDDGRLEVFYEDKNGDDGFDWAVRWGVLSP
ncbi:MAG: hypothetical protein GEU81_16400 [Nitriliruptorales bacterium]|nr:hypothetical protein [Nitriliruptorales bacterium]